DPKKPLKTGQSLIIPMSSATPKPTVTTAATAKTPASRRTETYTVRKGDTLAKIAAQFKVTVANLKSWNKLSSNQIAVGKKLIIMQPAPAQTAAARSETAPTASSDSHRLVHKVQQGETLNRIATLYNTTVDAILAWNKRNDLSVLHPGDQITIFVGN